MKILYTHLADPTCFGMGGSERILLGVVQAMKESYREEVALAVNRGELSQRVATLGIPVTEIFWSKANTLQTLKGLKTVIRKFQPEIIHGFQRYPVFLTDLFFKKEGRLVYTEQLFRKDKRFLFRYGHYVTACHPDVYEHMADYFKVPRSRMVMIPNAVPLRTPDAALVQSLRRQYPKGPRLFVFCAARLEEQKGHRYLIGAVARLPENYRGKLIFFLAGEGRLSNFLRREVVRRDIEGSFVFLGYEQRIPEFISFCDVTILPSLHEGLPLSILESYSLEKPVIASDIPGIRGTVLNKETGWLVPPQDEAALAEALKFFVDHPEEIQRMGRQAQQYWLQHFSFEKMIKDYHAFYQKIMGLPIPTA